MARLRLACLCAILLLGLPAARQQAQGDENNPQGAPVRHDCVRFDPNSVRVSGNGRRYSLVSDGTRINRVDGSRAEARLAVYIIRFYGMDEFCRIGGRGRAMSYYLVKGGAPSGRSPSEDCLWFDQTGSQLQLIDGDWTLVDRNNTALSLGSNRAAAVEALDTIRNRNFNEICFVGRPNASMVYFIR